MIGINILGYGQMGSQIASLLSLSGCDVAVWSPSNPSDAIVAKNQRYASKLLKVPMVENKIRVAFSIDELNKNSIIIESIVEDIDLKKELYSQCKGKFLNGYYTNTSSYSPAEIGDEVGGLHFFNPISLRLIEYCSPLSPLLENDINNSIINLITLLEQQQFKIIDVKSNRGYLANSLLFREIINAFIMIEQYEYSQASITNIYKSLGRNYDLFSVIDLIGVDTTYRILENLKEQDNSLYLPTTLREAIKVNILGRKNNTSICQLLK